MSDTPAAAEALRRVELLGALDDAALTRLAEHSVPVTLETGSVLVREGDASEAMYVVAEGLLEATKVEGGRPVRLATHGPGDVLGELGLLVGRPRSATVRALQPTRVLRIDAAAVDDLLEEPAVARRLLRTVVARLESQEGRLREHAKMAALGTLAAGLLHDIRNPAAALRAGVRRLGEALGQWRALAAVVDALPEEPRAAAERLAKVLRAEHAPESALARSDREEAVREWLERRGVARAWELAPVLAAAGVDAGGLETATAALDGPAVDVLLRWLVLDAEIERTIAEASSAAEHIAELTRRSTSFARLDATPVPDVDVHESLETVLALVRSRLRDVEVRRDFDEELPTIEGYPAELGGVWMNLVTNAVDAMGGAGVITLRTRRVEEDRVAVEVIDDGPGIPEEVRARVFEPFVTTKPAGAGTGLGLAQVHRVVVREHGGEVEVHSEPGSTCFRVVLWRHLPAPPEEDATA